MAFGNAATLLGPGMHATTFGGNPVCCAAGLAVLDTIAAEGLLDRVKRLGERLRRGIEGLGSPLVSHVRGAGLLLGIVLTEPASARLAASLQAAGFLAQSVQPDVLRLAPPYVLTDEQADGFLRAFARVVSASERSERVISAGREILAERGSRVGGVGSRSEATP
jgi:acetylornithine aminotransferase